jgi:threonyl-tRNA synthetase
MDENKLDKNDHRHIGKDLDLFTFSDTVGKGLPLYTEKGAAIRRELERFIVDEEIKRGYKHVITPDIAKLNLYEKSGHYPYYKENMYAPIEIDEEKFMLRPMTCPHHFELYLSKPRSYRDLPLRIAELAKLYRYENSGNLAGLVRVRSFCLSDSHIICADKEQAKSEVRMALELIEYIASIFGLKKGEDFWYRLSLGDRKDDKKYFKDDSAWDEAEKVLREVLQNQDVKFVEAENEAAFYGPKIDIQMKDIRGQENTAFTVQYDFVMPKRFNLTYTAKDGKETLAVVIHRSSIGAIERIMAFLIEKYAGAFPLWLSPVQVKVIPVRESHNAMSKGIFDMLLEAGIRAELLSEDENLGTKVRKAKEDKTNYWIVIGDKEVQNNTVTLESRDNGSLGQMTFEDALKKLLEEIKTRA